MRDFLKSWCAVFLEFLVSGAAGYLGILVRGIPWSFWCAGVAGFLGGFGAQDRFLEGFDAHVQLCFLDFWCAGFLGIFVRGCVWIS